MASRLIQDLPGRIKGGVLSVPVGISSLGCLLVFNNRNIYRHDLLFWYKFRLLDVLFNRGHCL